MGKVNVFTASKEYKCEKCSSPIPKGQKYYKITIRFQPIRYRCLNCKPKESELATGLRADIVSIEEDLQEWENNYRDPSSEGLQKLIEILEDSIGTLEYVQSELDEKVENIQEYFPDSELASQLEER